MQAITTFVSEASPADLEGLPVLAVPSRGTPQTTRQFAKAAGAKGKLSSRMVPLEVAGGHLGPDVKKPLQWVVNAALEKFLQLPELAPEVVDEWIGSMPTPLDLDDNSGWDDFDNEWYEAFPTENKDGPAPVEDEPSLPGPVEFPPVETPVERPDDDIQTVTPQFGTVSI